MGFLSWVKYESDSWLGKRFCVTVSRSVFQLPWLTPILTSFLFVVKDRMDEAAVTTLCGLVLATAPVDQTLL